MTHPYPAFIDRTLRDVHIAVNIYFYLLMRLRVGARPERLKTLVELEKLTEKRYEMRK